MSIGHNILRLRRNKNISVTELAKLIGVERQTIYDYQSDRTAPSKEKLEKLAQVLGVTKSDLWADETKERTRDIVETLKDMIELQKEKIINLEHELERFRKKKGG